MKVELEARNLEQKRRSREGRQKLDGQSFTVLRQAAEGGQLYGSVSPRDLAALVSENGFAIESRSDRAQRADQDHRHCTRCRSRCIRRSRSRSPSTVARNADEAERMARGEDITVAARGGRRKPRRPLAAAEAFFDPEAAEARRDARGRAEARAGGSQKIGRPASETVEG